MLQFSSSRIKLTLQKNVAVNVNLPLKINIGTEIFIMITNKITCRIMDAIPEKYVLNKC